MNGEALADLFFPPVCSICGANACPGGIAVCAECSDRLQELLARKCPSCGRSANECVCPRPEHLKFLFFYGSPLSKSLIYELKYGGNKTLVSMLAGLTVLSCGTDGLRADAVTYVPRYDRSIAKYGFDQAKMIAREIALKTGLPLVTTLVRNGGGEQKLMSADERKKHIAGLYTVDPALKEEDVSKRFLLVDDVATTGATLSACAEILRKHGARAVSAVAVAKTNLKI